MAEARTAPSPALSAPITDWTLRPFEATAIAPAWLGLALALAYIAVDLGMAYLALAMDSPSVGGEPIFDAEGWVDRSVNGMFLAFVPTAGAYGRRGVLRDLRDLRPSLSLSEAEFEQLVAQTTGPDPRRLRTAGLGFALVVLAAPLFDPVLTASYGPPSLTDPGYLWLLVRHAAVGWLFGHAVLTELDAARVYYRIGRESVEIDLLDLRPLAPFARKGQRSLLIFILWSSIFSLFWLGPGAASMNAHTLVGVLALAGVVFLAPVLGVHGRIRAAKGAELDRVHEAIRRERDATVAPREPGPPADARLANLIAYRDLVERVREWPFGAPTLLRVGLLIALGLGSWLGGALVERLLDTVLA